MLRSVGGGFPDSGGTRDNFDMLVSDIQDGLGLLSGAVRTGEGRIQDTIGWNEAFTAQVHAQDRCIQDMQHQLYDAAERRNLEDESLACSEDLRQQRMHLEMTVALDDGFGRNLEYVDDLDDPRAVVTRRARAVA